MKVVILAGGLGSRGKPFTDYCPKAMIPIEGRPIVDHVIRYVCKYSFITEIVIVCEFDSFGNQIINYFEGKENVIGKRIRFVEDKKNGTGGALLKCQELLNGESLFLVWYADNLCAVDLDDLYKKFESIVVKKQDHRPIGIVVTRSKRNEETGRVLVNKCYTDNVYTIESFIEKPLISLEYPEAFGIYLFSQEIFYELIQYVTCNHSRSFDLSADILSTIKFNKHTMLYSYDMGDTQKGWIDVESPTFIDRNKTRIKTIINEMNTIGR